MKFGVYRSDITPPFPMPMAGFGFRMDHFDAVHDPLTFTAVYLNDGKSEAWIGSADLCGFPDGPRRNEALQTLAARLGAPEAALFLNASHTHGGPEINRDFGIDRLDHQVMRTGANRERIDRYVDFLWERVGETLEKARAQAASGSLHFAEGPSTFSMSRRRLVNGRIENAPHPQGLVDGRIRLLSIKDTGGCVRALLPILACHPTSTGAQHRITGDFVTAWRQRLEAEWEGAQVAFLQACGGDLRPACTREDDHWRRAGLEELPAMGEHLLAETRQAIARGWRDLGPLQLSASFGVFHADCEQTYATRENLLPMLQDDRWWAVDFAREGLKRLDRGEKIPDQVAFRLHRLQLNRQCILLGLDCEPVCRLGLKLEQALSHSIALGYTNGCFGYVPTSVELLDGGYECESYMWEPWSGPFRPNISEWLVEKFRSLESPPAN